MLDVASLGFSLGAQILLHNVSFTLAQGEHLAVIGPNGSGKSTLLRCLMRVHPTGNYSGIITLMGQNIHQYNQPALARVVAYVPQAGGRIPPFTVAEFLHLSRYAHNTRTHSSPAADNAVTYALSTTGIEHIAHRPLWSLSGGERQKAYIAAALAQEPRLLLLDEPASFLDPHHVAELKNLLHSLNHDHGIAMITVTHDMSYPLRMGGKILALAAGTQCAFGSVCDVYTPELLTEVFQHPFVRTEHPLTHQTVILAED